jgi:hypothetical protein
MIVVFLRLLPVSLSAYILPAQHGSYKPDKKARRQMYEHPSQLLVGEICETGPTTAP